MFVVVIWRTVFIILALVALVAGLMVWNAQRRWQAANDELERRLLSGLDGRSPSVYVENELEGLPAPVERYFRTVLKDGQRIVRRARIEWRGEFNLGKPGSDNWKPFTATQIFVPSAPGSIWNARVMMAPGIPVLVRDGFVAGRGSMYGAVLGLVPVVEVEGTPLIAVGALLRYLAEIVWLPTALLPSEGVRWTPIDDTRARATLTVGATTGSVEFRFSPDGLVASGYSDERYFDGEDPPVKRPWEGVYARFAERNGVPVPIESHVQWNLPSGAFRYWRGTPVRIDYEYEAGPPAVRSPGAK